MTKTKNDKNWEKLFDKYDILNKIEEEGYFTITSQQINEYREARLMTKFDHAKNLPKIFKSNKLSILPVSRGTYRIGQFEAYYDKGELSWEDNEITFMSLPDIIESIDINNISSEAIAINAAIASGIMNDFLNTQIIIPTIDGRMGTSDFSYYIKIKNSESMKVDVSKAQIEIDAGLETDKSLVLIEAKNSQSKTILTRQLYYPYRYWSERLAKGIRLIYMEYFNANFYLYEFKFKDLEKYDSLRIVKKKVYSLVENKVTIELINTLLNNTNVQKEPQGVPFPQADDFDKIIIICEMLKKNDRLNNIEITNNFDFDKRQTDYYTNAAIYLGLVSIQTVGTTKNYILSDFAKELMARTIHDRKLGFIQVILQMPVFRKVFTERQNNNSCYLNCEIVEVMKEHGINYGESTLTRRAQTVNSWISWVENQAKD